MIRESIFTALLISVSLPACGRKSSSSGEGDLPPSPGASESEKGGTKDPQAQASGFGIHVLGDAPNAWLPDLSQASLSEIPQDQPCADTRFGETTRPYVIKTGLRFCVPGGKAPLVIADYNFDTRIYSERSVVVVALDPTGARVDAPTILFDLVRSSPRRGTNERQYSLNLIATEKVFGSSDSKTRLTFLCDGLSDGSCRAKPVIVNNASSANKWNIPLSIRFPTGVSQGTLEVRFSNRSARIAPRWFSHATLPLPNARPR